MPNITDSATLESLDALNSIEVEGRDGQIYTRGQLHAALDRIKAGHWKNPIAAVILPEERGMMEAAIEFFQGCLPVCEPIVNSGRIFIQSTGYIG
jgi:hypothetical protein